MIYLAMWGSRAPIQEQRRMSFGGGRLPGVVVVVGDKVVEEEGR